MTVAFDPTQLGTFNDSIGLETTGGNGQIGLSARPALRGRCRSTAWSTNTARSSWAVSPTKSFTITNTGGTAVTITKSKPPIGGEFTPATELPEGTTIQAGESVTEQVTFAPTELGAAGEWLINGEDTTGLHAVLFTGIGANPVVDRNHEPPSQAANQGGVPQLGILHPLSNGQGSPARAKLRPCRDVQGSVRGTISPAA